MRTLFPCPIAALGIKHAAVALSLAAMTAGATAANLPQFTFDPTAVGLAGAAFMADNLLISNYSTVTLGTGNSFTETGYLAITSAQLAGSTFLPAGLGGSYGMYIAFTGSGTTSGGDPASVPTFGTLSSLSYTLYGYNGSAAFGFSGTTPIESASGEVALAAGTLMNGTVVTIPSGDGLTFSPSASVKASVSPLMAAFFVAPTPFYDLAMTAFSNTTSQVETFDGGFLIRQGGGSINFASAVPEPSGSVLLLAGMGAVGFMVRRRRPDSSR